ncbi:MAG: nicotinamide-nucleotide amidase [Desulfonauticus sp.]|nr:MAG: Competence/damage-inducible protein CinA-like protein [Desulfonauticus sp. 38_4375]MDK2922044.1 nicotinamide-nucleotide amidase [Desulfonauticus sp.]
MNKQNITMDQEKVLKLASYLQSNGLKLGVAESCTGGLLAHTLTNVSGSSSWFMGGVVAYANSVKEKVLGVSAHTLEKFGAVSTECVLEMVRGVANLLEVEVAVAISGIAGPTGGTLEKPVGTVFQAYLVGDKLWSKKFLFSGSRYEIKVQSVQKALEELIGYWE